LYEKLHILDGQISFFEIKSLNWIDEQVSLKLDLGDLTALAPTDTVDFKQQLCMTIDDYKLGCFQHSVVLTADDVRPIINLDEALIQLNIDKITLVVHFEEVTENLTKLNEHISNMNSIFTFEIDNYLNDVEGHIGHIYSRMTSLSRYSSNMRRLVKIMKKLDKRLNAKEYLLLDELLNIACTETNNQLDILAQRLDWDDLPKEYFVKKRNRR